MSIIKSRKWYSQIEHAVWRQSDRRHAAKSDSALCGVSQRQQSQDHGMTVWWYSLKCWIFHFFLRSWFNKVIAFMWAMWVLAVSLIYGMHSPSAEFENGMRHLVRWSISRKSEISTTCMIADVKIIATQFCIPLKPNIAKKMIASSQQYSYW